MKRWVISISVAILVSSLVSLWRAAPVMEGDGAFGKAERLGEAQDQETLYVGDFKADKSPRVTETRHFEQSSIGVDGVFRSTPASMPGAALKIELYRVEESARDVFVGERTIESNGIGSALWLGVGPGDYYLQLSVKDPESCVSISSFMFYSVEYE